MSQNLPGLIVLSLLAFVGGSLWLIPGEDWSALVVYLPVVVLIAVFTYKRLLKLIDPDFPSALYTLAFLAKLLGSLARYWMLVDLYNGRGDAGFYHDQGQFLASNYFRDLDFSILEYYQARSEGTTNTAIMTGLVYTVLPPSLPSTYLLFATLAFAGAVLFYCAFRIGFPEVLPDFYRLIIFFLPSVLFWPSSLGKDSWIFFASGIVAYGLANFIRQGRFMGIITAAIGLLLIYFIRPHFSAFLVLSVGLGYVVGFRRLFSQQHPFILIVGGGLLIAAFMYIGPQIQNSFGIDEVSIEEVESSIQNVQSRTTTGSSRYKTVSILSPSGFLLGIVTVVFRPFPWEADNAAVMFTALEGFVWLGLVWTRRRVFWGRLRNIYKDPFLAFLVFYTLLTILAFTSLGNFGILARQRVFFLPFFWMLFA